MKKIVAKFGGSNLKTVEDIQKITATVRTYDRPMVAVVSAFYGITNRLTSSILECRDDESRIAALQDFLREMKEDLIGRCIQSPQERERTTAELGRRLDELRRVLLGVHYLGEIPLTVNDRVLSYGERLSSFLLAAIFRDAGIDAVEALPEDIGLFTNGEFRNASVDFERSLNPVAEALSADRVFVIPGFYGISPEGKTTLLGRGGSDYSAAAIACCIQAESLDIWKDVDGFMSGDPGMVDTPHRLHTLSYLEAAELSYFGARILHPRTVEPLREPGIPVRIFNIHRYNEGIVPLSVIGPVPAPLQNAMGDEMPHRVKSVTCSNDFAILRLRGSGVGQTPGVLGKAAAAVAEAGINIKSVMTTQTSINLFLSEADIHEAQRAVELTGLSAVSRVESQTDLSIIALVGEGLSECEEIADRLVVALSRAGVHIKMLALGASESATYFVVSREMVQTALKAAHSAFFPGNHEPLR
ncbi:aspartate kinase [Spirochaeta dissipatitropha]